MKNKWTKPSSMKRQTSWWIGIGLILLFLLLCLLIAFTQFKEYYDSLDPMLSTLQTTLIPLHPKVKEVQFFEGHKSYTINKRKIYLCLKDKRKQYYPFNMLLYVSIHELAHVLCDEIGHTPKFDSIFHHLLQRAIELNIYDPTQPILSDYCGHH